MINKVRFDFFGLLNRCAEMVLAVVLELGVEFEDVGVLEATAKKDYFAFSVGNEFV